MLFSFFKAFKYSIPKILFGEDKILLYSKRFSGESFCKYFAQAISRALGKEEPLFNSSLRNV